MRLERGPRYHAHTGPVHVARLASKGKYVLTGGADGRVCLWNATSPPREAVTEEGLHSPIEAYKAAAREVLAIDVAQDNSTFASAGNDRNVVLWDVVTAAPIRRLQGSVSGRTHSVVFAGRPAGSTGPFRPDGSILAAGGFDGVVRVYDLRSQGIKPLMELPEAKDAVLTLATHQHALVSGSVDGVVRTYDVRSGRLFADDMRDPITSVMLSNESRMLVTALHAPPRILGTNDGRLLARLDGAPHADYRCHAGLLPDGSLALGGGEDGKIYLWSSEASATSSPNPPETLPPLQPAACSARHALTDTTRRAPQVLWSDIITCSDGSTKGVSAGSDGCVQAWTVA